MENPSSHHESQIRVHSQLSDDSLLQESVSTFSVMNGSLTFKELIDYVKRIESNYKQISAKLE